MLHYPLQEIFAGRGSAPRRESGPVAARAQVAELVDALVSGISGGNIVGVRVPSWASFYGVSWQK
jgi:hypothetical protein